MKKLSAFIITSTLLATPPGTSVAAICTIIESAIGCDTCAVTERKIRCVDITYCDCISCADGTTPIQKTIQPSPGESYTYGLCRGGTVIPVTCPTDCPEEDWTIQLGTNYQTRCVKITPARCEYRCNPGYYGSGTTCDRCPPSGAIFGTTAGPGATQIIECYLPTGTEFNDSTGSGAFSNDCYYQD